MLCVDIVLCVVPRGVFAKLIRCLSLKAEKGGMLGYVHKYYLKFVSYHRNFLRELCCHFPVISTYFYTVLCGEQEGSLQVSRYNIFNFLIYK